MKIEGSHRLLIPFSLCRLVYERLPVLRTTQRGVCGYDLDLIVSFSALVYCVATRTKIKRFVYED